MDKLESGHVDQLSRRELQRYAKMINVRANQKSCVIREALRSYLERQLASIPEDDVQDDDDSQKVKVQDSAIEKVLEDDVEQDVEALDTLTDPNDERDSLDIEPSVRLRPSIAAILTRNRNFEESVLAPETNDGKETLQNDDKDIITPKNDTVHVEPGFETPVNVFERRWNALPYAPPAENSPNMSQIAGPAEEKPSQLFQLMRHKFPTPAGVASKAVGCGHHRGACHSRGVLPPPTKTSLPSMQTKLPATVQKKKKAKRKALKSLCTRGLSVRSKSNKRTAQLSKGSSRPAKKFRGATKRPKAVAISRSRARPRKTFDLKASLSRNLPWKLKKGKVPR